MSTQVKQCRSCKAAIIWATTTNDKPMPLDASPVLDGKFFLSPGGQAVHVDNDGEFAASCRAANSRRYTSHFVTCPNRDEHRKAK